MTATQTDKSAPGSAAIPEARGSQPHASREAMDAALADLVRRKDAWVAVDIPARVALLSELIDTCLAACPRWIAAAVEAKGIRPGTPPEGEEWIAGPALVLRNLRLLAQSLEDVERYGHPRLPGPPRRRPDGQVVAPVFPASFWDKAFFPGFTAEVWMEPGVTLEGLPETQAVAYRAKRGLPPEKLAGRGKVALVLGAGNVASIGPMDALYKLFVEDQVVVLKMNPVNEYLGPIFAEALRPLVDRGFLRVVLGGAAEGAYLCRHDAVDEIHITGSDKTHDAIVYGTGPEGRQRREERRPLIAKRVTSELGNVSPVIVVPGPWDEGDLAYQGTNLASMLGNNAGFNCNALRVIVQHKGWAGRAPLLDAVRAVMRRTPPRVAYYPGAEDRQKAFVAAHPEADRFGEAGGGRLPWTLVADVDPARRDDICFTTEAFCGVCAETGLEAATPAAFLDRAVEFCNDTLWGTLNAAIVVHPRSLEDPEVAAALDRAIARLRYGTVAINHWPAIGYALVATTWGAHPGHELHDIGSGIGVVHNGFLFDRPQKSIVRGPFRVKPTPPWFVTHRTCHQLGPKLARFEARPSLLKLPGLLWSALRG